MNRNTKHCDRKDAARKRREKDKELYQTDDNVTALAVNLQSVLLAPMGNLSAFYYHSKLASYNYTIFDLHSKTATWYFWHERERTLQADCFASCLVDFLTHNESCQAARKIIVHSDGCSYKNRNVVLSNALLHFSIFSRKEVLQKILEKGHTQMECHSVHATIEKSIKNRNIYVPGRLRSFCSKR